MEILLALPQDIHDWAFNCFAATCESEERRGSLRSTVCIEGYLTDQLFDVEYLVHHQSVEMERWLSLVKCCG
jgi:hypothetical protein